MRRPLLLLLLPGLTICARAAVQELRPGTQLRGELIQLDEETKWYKPVGLIPGARYEVTVSYPASLPADVDVRLVASSSSSGDGGGGGGSSSGGVDDNSQGNAPEDDDEGDDDNQSSPKSARLLRRRLLDLEKASFRAGASGRPVLSSSASSAAAATNDDADSVLVSVRARRRSPRAPGAIHPGPDLLPYNVRLGRAYLPPSGLVPAEALPAAGALLVLVAAVLAWWLPRWVGRGGTGGVSEAQGWFRVLLDWVVGDVAGGGGGGAAAAKTARRGGRGGGAAAAAATARTPSKRTVAKTRAGGGG